MENAQETTFILRRGDARAEFGSNLRKRISHVHPASDNEHIAHRAHQYSTAAEIIDSYLEEFETRHLKAATAAVEKHVECGQGDIEHRIPTTLLLNSGQIIASLERHFPCWRTVVLRAKECGSTKITAKLVVKRLSGEDEDTIDADKRLIYDFDVLVQWLAAMPPDRKAQRLVVVLEDTDSFAPEILSSLIDLMHAYTLEGTLPFHLILNLSMPPVLLEEKLTRDNVTSIAAEYVSGAPQSAAFIAECLEQLKSRDIYVNSGLRRLLSESQRHVREAARLLKYACLAHFTGNPYAGYTEAPKSAEQMEPASLSGLAKLTRGDTEWALELFGRAIKGDENDVSSIVHVGAWSLEATFNPTFRPLLESTLTEPSTTEPSIRREAIPLCVLYQLYRESSIFINLYDFYTAFSAMTAHDDNDPDWPHHSMALFLEAVGELKIMGIIRDCKRKYECVEKVSWKDV